MKAVHEDYIAKYFYVVKLLVSAPRTIPELMEWSELSDQSVRRCLDAAEGEGLIVRTSEVRNCRGVHGGHPAIVWKWAR